MRTSSPRNAVLRVSPRRRASGPKVSRAPNQGVTYFISRASHIGSESIGIEILYYRQSFDLRIDVDSPRSWVSSPSDGRTTKGKENDIDHLIYGILEKHLI